jgi:hypothetical protein
MIVKKKERVMMQKVGHGGKTLFIKGEKRVTFSSAQIDVCLKRIYVGGSVKLHRFERKWKSKK